MWYNYYHRHVYIQCARVQVWLRTCGWLPQVCMSPNMDSSKCSTFKKLCQARKARKSHALLPPPSPCTIIIVRSWARPSCIPARPSKLHKSTVAMHFYKSKTYHCLDWQHPLTIAHVKVTSTPSSFFNSCGDIEKFIQFPPHPLGQAVNSGSPKSLKFSTITLQEDH